MDNTLSDILDTVSFQSAVYFKHGFCSPWGMDSQTSPFSQFHMVTGGRCMLVFEGRKLDLEKGDIAIFPHGHPHQIKDAEATVCASGQESVQRIMNGETPFPGSDTSTHLICGHYQLDRDLSHPLLDQLPSFILIKSEDYGRFELIHAVFELIVDEMSQRRPGYLSVALSLAEVLFVSVVRHYYFNQSETGPRIFKDALIYQVLDAIHKQIDEDWNLDKMARLAGISRTLFIDRFKTAVGQTPMAYVNDWRLTKAKSLLKNTDATLIDVCDQIGYHSNASFNRAFKQKYGISPGKFRKSARAQVNTP